MARAHEVVRRGKTRDGVEVVAWDDGMITGRNGEGLPGVGAPRGGPNRRELAALLVLDDACLYDWDELPRLIRAARRAAEQDREPPHALMRRLFAASAPRGGKGRRAGARCESCGGPGPLGRGDGETGRLCRGCLGEIDARLNDPPRARRRESLSAFAARVLRETR